MIWLVGGSGMLGTEVRLLLEDRGLDHFATGAETDITDADAVAEIVRQRAPTWIINCAAYTAVDQAESDEDQAHAVNALGVKHLALAATDVGARVIHVSTDYVFDGRAAAPYPEDAATNPIGAYGRSKEAGERFLREVCPQHFIVRTAWLHGPHGGNFVATMLRLMAERPELGVVDDQRGSPTYAADLADALLAFIAGDQRTFGTYHYTNTGVCTWHGFATAIQSQAIALGLLQAAVPIRPVPTSAYPTPAARPSNSALETARIQAVLRLPIPSWEDGLHRHLQTLAPERDRLS